MSDKTFSAAMDSVKLCNTSTMSMFSSKEDFNDAISRNVEHLKIVLPQLEEEGYDVSEIEDCIKQHS